MKEKSMSQKLNIKSGDEKVLIQLSGSQCAICKKKLYDINKNISAINIGVIAHICGEKPGSARYDAKMTNEERQSYNNLIFVCPTCHTIIDKEEQIYTAEKLHKIKDEHIKNVINDLETNIDKVSCKELDFILQCIISPNENQLDKEDYSIIHPQEKINKNSLSSGMAQCIKMGMANFNMIKNYINRLTSIKLNFEQNLRRAFIDKYLELKQENLSGDEIFIKIWDFAKCNHDSDIISAAALSIVSYFFLECDIFEK